MITVYHLGEMIDLDTQLDIRCMFEIEKVEPLIQKLWRELHYIPVATIDTDSLGVAWMLTNNIDESWVHNPEIADLHTGGVVIDGRRSSCVGDIMERNGKFSVIARIGHQDIDLPPSPFKEQ